MTAVLPIPKTKKTYPRPRDNVMTILNMCT